MQEYAVTRWRTGVNVHGIFNFLIDNNYWCCQGVTPISHCHFLNPFTAKFSQRQISTKFPHFILWNFEKQIAPCVSTGRELLFEWSLHRILSKESKVRVTLQNSIEHSGGVKGQTRGFTPRSQSIINKKGQFNEKGVFWAQ